MSDAKHLSVGAILGWIDVYGHICPSCRTEAWVSCVRAQKVQPRACPERHGTASRTPFGFTVEQLEAAATNVVDLAELAEPRWGRPLSLLKLEQLKQIHGRMDAK